MMWKFRVCVPVYRGRNLILCILCLAAQLTANCEELTARVEVMRETEKQQLQDSNATLEHLQVLQHKEKQHQSIVIDWVSRVHNTFA